MTTEDITLSTTSHSANEFGELSIIKNVNLLFNDISVLLVGAIHCDENIISESKKQAALEMKCEIDDVISEIEAEVNKLKLKIKKEYPIRTRLRLFTTTIKRPVSFLFGAFLLAINKPWPKK